MFIQNSQTVKRYFYFLIVLFLFVSCNKETNQKGTFGYDLEFLKQHHPDLILLKLIQSVTSPIYFLFINNVRTKAMFIHC